MSSIVGDRSGDGWESPAGWEMRLARRWEDCKGPQMPGWRIRSQGQWRATEGSKLGSGLLKVAAMEGPQLEAGRLVDCPKGPVRGQRPHLGLEQWAQTGSKNHRRQRQGSWQDLQLAGGRVGVA